MCVWFGSVTSACSLYPWSGTKINIEYSVCVCARTCVCGVPCLHDIMLVCVCVCVCVVVVGCMCVTINQ